MALQPTFEAVKEGDQIPTVTLNCDSQRLVLWAACISALIVGTALLNLGADLAVLQDALRAVLHSRLDEVIDGGLTVVSEDVPSGREDRGAWFTVLHDSRVDETSCIV